MICLISWPILIFSRCDWHRLKGLFKGFQVLLRLWESSKIWPNEVCDTTSWNYQTKESYLGISYNVEQDTVTWVNTTKDLSLLQTQHAHVVKQLRHESISSSHAPPMKNITLSYAKHHKHYIYLTSLAPRMAYKPWHPS